MTGQEVEMPLTKMLMMLLLDDEERLERVVADK